MAFSRLDAKKQQLKDQISYLNQMKASQELGLQKGNINYSDKSSIIIKPKLFQRGKVNQIFQQLEEELQEKVQNIYPNKSDYQDKKNVFEIRNWNNQTNDSLLLEGSQLQNNYEKEQLLGSFQRIHHQNSYPDKDDHKRSCDSDQNLKNALKNLEQQNSISYNTDYNINDNSFQYQKKFSPRSERKMKVKIIKMDKEDSMNQSSFLPSIMNKNKHRSYSPSSRMKSNSNNSILHEQLATSQQQQKQTLLVNKKQPYIIKKLNKSTLEQIDESLNQFTLKICNPQSNSNQVSQAIIDLITKIFSLRQNQSELNNKFYDILDNIHFCKKDSPLFQAIQSELSKQIQVDDKQNQISFKELCLSIFVELVEQKNVFIEHFEKIISEKQEIKQKIDYLGQIIQSLNNNEYLFSHKLPEINLIFEQINNQISDLSEEYLYINKIKQSESDQIINNEFQQNKYIIQNVKQEQQNQKIDNFYSRILQNNDEKTQLASRSYQNQQIYQHQ